jgi:hypothetical protein
MLKRANPALFRTGVFYVLNPNVIASLSNPLRENLHTTTTVDMIFAHGGTAYPGTHPTTIYESAADRKLLEVRREDLEGNALNSISNRSDLDRKWPSFLASRPDAMKVYLYHSESFDAVSSSKPPQGLSPDLVAEIVRRARAAGLRSLAHIESDS